MLDLCRNLDEKTSQQTYHSYEVSEFNLSLSTKLRCGSDKFVTCGECETCLLNTRIIASKENLSRFGDHTKRRFLLGLTRRINSVDMLVNLTNQLGAVLGKDFTYARSRPCPSLLTDHVTVSMDRALSQQDVEKFIHSSWQWFQSCSYWSKLNYLLIVLHDCDVHLLGSVCNQAMSLLATEQKAAALAESNLIADADSTSVKSNFSYHTNDNPDLALLAMCNPSYSSIDKDPFSGAELPEHVIEEIYDDDSDNESNLSSIDPTCLVIPTSSKAISGVARYCDFIRCLPVFLSKMILSLLDQATLYNAICVTKYWRSLAEEVQQEFYVNQQLWEDVMLLQGGAAQSVNPTYAKDIDVLVPKVNPYTQEMIKSDNAIIKTSFKSEESFNTAYSGVSTRKIIMEERNVYCGAYNVLVLIDKVDPHRVFTITGDHIVAIGGKDNKVRFIDTDTGRETGPVITGHSGSIRCIAICKEKGVVVSGSYDTSIRMWNLQTGQCMKIMHGHRDTVVSVVIHANILASASKDASCKVWDINTGKCLRTFRHRKPLMSINTDGKTCITGCEGGRVKVWDIETGNIIKKLNAHHGAVTGIKFDRWHIVTSSKDGYALAWSALGDHSRCLAALHHPKEVLTLEFMYLRAITGCADGRLRIWNIINGQCCRIMRGNSRSDSIHSIIAIGDRISLNTHANLLLLNFEKVDWDYTLENDAVPPLVQYGKYSDSPVRPQAYSYVRAQRMKRAGATNPQILKGKKSERGLSRLAHSAKPISDKHMDKARKIQSGKCKAESSPSSRAKSSPQLQKVESWLTTSSRGNGSICASYGKINTSTLNFRMPVSAPIKKSISCDTKKSKSQGHRSVSIAENKFDIEDFSSNKVIPYKRRVSWAFERQNIPKSHEMTLSETKSLLRSQIRMREEHIVPPDFVYLSVNAIQSTLAQSETAKNTENNLFDAHTVHLMFNERSNMKQQRPLSGPMRIDPRNKIPTEQLNWDKFLEDVDAETASVMSVKSMKPKNTPKYEVKPEVMKNEIYTTRLSVIPLSRERRMNPCSDEVTSTDVVIRPHTAFITQMCSDVETKRPATAIGLKDIHPLSLRQAFPGNGLLKKRMKTITSSAAEVDMVPMLMYPRDMKQRLMKLKDRVRHHDNDAQDEKRPSSCPTMGKVSQYNHPLRTHARFTLRTHEQEEIIIRNAEREEARQRLSKNVKLKQRCQTK